ncbi:hypothetical protein CFIO01_08492 [Colletotrichum fioriniae PJ7]|uniref:Uncharacterized protein n=1 Tax=Colletotrichum fioriniae PJ7 TaxID=1445577 RepID=A0A010QPW2_9PEZI|nr:hypothetical protein CFIO01_08492 [Colletotrichum fioriniae PJ7]
MQQNEEQHLASSVLSTSVNGSNNNTTFAAVLRLPVLAKPKLRQRPISHVHSASRIREGYGQDGAQPRNDHRHKRILRYGPSSALVTHPRANTDEPCPTLPSGSCPPLHFWSGALCALLALHLNPRTKAHQTGRHSVPIIGCCTRLEHHPATSHPACFQRFPVSLLCHSLKAKASPPRGPDLAEEPSD